MPALDDPTEATAQAFQCVSAKPEQLEQLAELVCGIGIDPSLRQCGGMFDSWSLLHVAAWNGQIGLTELLLGLRADVTATNKKGDTALRLAAHKGQLAVAGLLLQAQADPLAANSGGVSPIDSASAGSAGEDGALLELLERAASGSVPLTSAPTERIALILSTHRAAAVPTRVASAAALSSSVSATSAPVAPASTAKPFLPPLDFSYRRPATCWADEESDEDEPPSYEPRLQVFNVVARGSAARTSTPRTTTPPTTHAVTKPAPAVLPVSQAVSRLGLGAAAEAKPGASRFGCGPAALASRSRSRDVEGRPDVGFFSA